MRERKEGFYAVTLLAPSTNCTKDDMARYKSILFKHMKRYAKSNGLQFEVYGCFTNAHVSKGTPYLRFVVYGVGASTIAQEMRAAWLKRWPNARWSKKGGVYDLYGWLECTKRDYRMAADGLHGWACCSFGLSRKKRKQQEKLLCLRWDESEQK